MLKRKGFIWITVIMVLMLALAAAGCGKSETPTSPGKDTQSSAKNDAPIKIGVIGAFSGGSAEMGLPMRKGIEMAAKEINDAGGIEGRKIELVAYDDEANASKNTTLAKRAIDTDKVVALLAAPNSGTSIATAKVANQMQVPQIVPIAQSPEVLQPFSPWVFRGTHPSNIDIERLVSYAKEKNWNKIAIVHDTSAFGMSGEKILKNAIPKAGLQLVASVGHPVGATDVTAQALEIKEAKPDAIVQWNLGADAALIAKALQNVNFKVPILAGRGLFFNVYTELGKDAVEGTIATGALDFTRPDVQQWKEKFLANGGTEGGIDFAALGYDAMSVLAEALKNVGAAGADDRQKVRDAIESVTAYKSITGYEGATIGYGPNQHEGSTIKHSVLQTVKNGKWSEMAK